MGVLAGMLAQPIPESSLVPREQLIYPIVHRYAQDYGVEIPLVMAVISVESSFIPRAKHTDRDGKSSYGLMQLRLDTARPLAPRDPPLSEEDIYNPDLNIELGTKYLRYQLDRYGNMADAAAAYNAGSVIRGATGDYINARYVKNVLAWVDYYRANLPAHDVQELPDWFGQQVSSPRGEQEGSGDVVPFRPTQGSMFGTDTLTTILIFGAAGLVLLLLFPRG